MFTIQETHYNTKGRVKIPNFEMFEVIRSKGKGGTVLGAHKALQPILISEYSQNFELLVVEVKVSKREIRVITGYGPQENLPEQERLEFFITLEKEIIRAECDNKQVIIQLDANSKLGPELIPGDLHPQSPNGKILASLIYRNNLTIGNLMNCCQ